MSKDKEYIVDKNIDLEFTEEERERMRTKKAPTDPDPVQKYKRQDIFVDRRDPFAEKDPVLPERRKRDRDRRETDK
jgi:hypothetical protein